MHLPCGHSYCAACLAQLRAKEVAQACPLCREQLPDGLAGLYDLAWRTYDRVWQTAQKGKISWTNLPAAEQEEMKESVVMFSECAVHNHRRATLEL